MPVDPNAEIEVTAYASIIPEAHGHVKDIRVRWALEEIGRPYRERLIGGAFGDKSDEYLAEQPFGQVPVLRDGDLTLFESGAILIHLGEKDQRLLSRDTNGRARAFAWMLAAQTSIEPFLGAMVLMEIAGEGQSWRNPAVNAARPYAERRLAQTSHWLGDKDWLEDRFTIGDLMMVDVLREAPDRLIAAHANLVAYVERGKARPAFKVAMAAHLAAFEANTPVPA